MIFYFLFSPLVFLIGRISEKFHFMSIFGDKTTLFISKHQLNVKNRVLTHQIISLQSKLWIVALLFSKISHGCHFPLQNAVSHPDLVTSAAQAPGATRPLTVTLITQESREHPRRVMEE